MLAAMSDTATAVVRLRDGAELLTAVSGTGPPVVCLHGGPGLWDYLAPLAALLDDTFTVVRFDQRGCGRSTGHDGPFTIEQAVDDLDQVRAALGFSRWAVAGHSWGAELALRYAARHQDRTTAVAYIAGVGAGTGGPPPCRRPRHLPCDDDLRQRRPAPLDGSRLPARSPPQRQPDRAHRSRARPLGRAADGHPQPDHRRPEADPFRRIAAVTEVSEAAQAGRKRRADQVSSMATCRTGRSPSAAASAASRSRLRSVPSLPALG